MTKKKLLFFILLFAALLGPIAGELGEFLKSSHQIKLAESVWKVGSFMQNRKSIQGLGFLYWSGETKRRPEDALQLLESIPDYTLNHVARMVAIGSIYEFKGDFNKAIEYYQFACLAQSVQACSLLSYLLLKVGDYKESFRLARLVEEQGYKDISFLLAIHHLNGLGGLKVDVLRARDYLRECIRTCSYMNTLSNEILGVIEQSPNEFVNHDDYLFWKPFLKKYLSEELNL